MAKATRMPQGGGFQTLLSGGDSGLNLPAKQAVQDLRALSNHPVLGPIADEMRRTGGVADNEAGFYGLTNAMRNMQEARQAASAGSAATGGPNPVKNPQSYAAGIRNRQAYAAQTFADAPPGPVKDLVSHMATSTSSAARQALYDAIHATSSGPEKDFLEQRVAHMIHYGNKK
jgi:hypothetical protein